MKKNRMMRLASGLLVAVLLTTSVISGTFAKYTTSASSQDSARVAKFGVVVTANGQTFKTSEYGITTGWTSKNVMESSKDPKDNVLAPGTSGEMVKMTLAGQPEVAVKVTYDVTKFDLNNWTLYDGTTEYCPLVFTINNVTYQIGTTTSTDTAKYFDTVENLETGIIAAINGYSKEYEPNELLSSDTVKGDSLAVSWNWAIGVNDVNDTILGNKAAGIDANGDAITPVDATVEIAIKTTVTQID